MPYLTSERKEALKGAWKDLTPGDLNYLFTELMIQKWLEKPSYSKIHELKQATYQMACDDQFWDLRATLMEHGISEVDIRVAAELAFLEFYRRAASDYEDFKASQNGDVYEDVVNDLYERLK